MPEEIINQAPQTEPVKKVSPKKIIFVILGLILFTTISSGYLFLFVPEAQAKEFIKKTSETFGEITDKVDSAYSSFLKIKSEVPLAKSSFDEIATPTADYNYIKKDTEQDIADILQLKQNLSQAQEELAKLPRPGKVKQLGQSLEKYYQNLDETLNDLLAHQRLNEALINAQGQTLYDELLKLEDFFNNGGGNRQELNEISVNLSSLARVSLEKTKKIENVDPREKDYRQAKIDYLEDMITTFDSVQPLISAAQDKEVNLLIWAFAARVKLINERVQKNADKYVQSSKAAIGFKQLPKLEEKVFTELEKVAAESDLKPLENKKSKTSTSSAN